jgi:hypothetical protein
VELRTQFGYGKDAGSNLDLTRDLSQAIYEYAPDATIVAGGRLWTSRGIYRLPGRDLVEYQYFVCKRCGGFRHGIDAVDPVCEHCGEMAQSAPRRLTIPEFGFVAGREPERPGPRPPRRSWSGAVHVLAESPEARSHTMYLTGGTIGVKVGPRGRLIALADRPSAMGFWVCDWCGYGSARVFHPQKPPRHNHLLKSQPCGGPQRLLDLAHAYETDLLTLELDVPGFQGAQPAWKSVLYAILEAACEVLEIARDDIGGSLSPFGAERWSVALFDAVSGGAGHVLQIEANLKKVLAAALRRVSTCECGPETSCYGCLRSYSNQRDHDELSRGQPSRSCADCSTTSARSTSPTHTGTAREQLRAPSLLAGPSSGRQLRPPSGTCWQCSKTEVRHDPSWVRRAPAVLPYRLRGPTGCWQPTLVSPSKTSSTSSRKAGQCSRRDQHSSKQPECRSQAIAAFQDGRQVPQLVSGL